MPVCGKCHIALPERTFTKITRNAFRSAGTLVVLMAVSVGSVALYAGFFAAGNAPAISRSATCAAPQQPTDGIYGVSDHSPRVARLTIRVSSGANYFVKLDDADTGLPVMSFFISGGSTLHAKVPLGRFTLKYATGELWCGESELFAPSTVTSRADKTFQFERQFTGDGYTLSQWTVELVLQRGGNLRTKRIPRETF